MKYSPLIYAKALKLVLAKTPASHLDRLVKNFKAILVKNGDVSQGSKIIEELEGILVRAAGGKIVNLEMARPLSNPQLKLLISRFGERDIPRQKINPRLIAGLRLTINGNWELDQSLARKLDQIFN